MLLSLSVLLLAIPTLAVTITGTVKGPDSKSLMAAFVIAGNTHNKMAVSVLSDDQTVITLPTYRRLPTRYEPERSVLRAIPAPECSWPDNVHFSPECDVSNRDFGFSAFPEGCHTPSVDIS